MSRRVIRRPDRNRRRLNTTVATVKRQNATSTPGVSARFTSVELNEKPITTAAIELGISAAALHKWVRQDQVDRGERPGLTTTESAQLSKANKRIRQLEAEVEILRTAATLFGENRPAPKGFTR